MRDLRIHDNDLIAAHSRTFVLDPGRLQSAAAHQRRRVGRTPGLFYARSCLSGVHGEDEDAQKSNDGDARAPQLRPINGMSAIMVM